jgi:hypothetical protein
VAAVSFFFVPNLRDCGEVIIGACGVGKTEYAWRSGGIFQFVLVQCRISITQTRPESIVLTAGPLVRGQPPSSHRYLTRYQNTMKQIYSSIHDSCGIDSVKNVFLIL